jgi:hypothetical protein
MVNYWAPGPTKLGLFTAKPGKREVTRFPLSVSTRRQGQLTYSRSLLTTTHCEMMDGCCPQARRPMSAAHRRSNFRSMLNTGHDVRLTLKTYMP